MSIEIKSNSQNEEENYVMITDCEIPDELSEKLHKTSSKIIRDKEGNIIRYEW